MTKIKAKKPKKLKKADGSKTKDTTNKTQNKKIKKKKKASTFPKQDGAKTASISDSESDSEPELVEIQKLLEPCSKEKLVDFVIEVALKDDALFNRIRDAADNDVSHRKIFVHGLAWGTTREALLPIFQQYGEIDDCTVVVDRVTGKTKGYGFILFKNRKGAVKALKQPKKMIGNRTVWCQLSSVGPMSQPQDKPDRRIYVSNVSSNVDPDKLRKFFEKFGEIERGPTGLDTHTGKFRGYALFLYKTVEGAKKVLEEPYKMFDGQQLHCSRATESKDKSSAAGGAASVTTSVQPMQPEVLAAVAAAQNMALYGQFSAFNPLYGGLIGAGTGVVNPLLAAGGLNLMGHVGAGPAGGVGVMGSNTMGSFGGSTPLHGAYAGSGDAGLQQAYPNTQIGQASASRPQGPGVSSSTYPSYK